MTKSYGDPHTLPPVVQMKTIPAHGGEVTENPVSDQHLVLYSCHFRKRKEKKEKKKRWRILGRRAIIGLVAISTLTL